jgi:hypothetical protein
MFPSESTFLIPFEPVLSARARLESAVDLLSFGMFLLYNKMQKRLTRKLKLKTKRVGVREGVQTTRKPQK